MKELESPQETLLPPPRCCKDTGWTADELFTTPPDCEDCDGEVVGYEIDEEGRLEPMAGESPHNQLVKFELCTVLQDEVEPQGLGLIYPELSIVLDPVARRPVVIADLAFVAKSSLERVNDNIGIDGVPEVAVEVLSPSNVGEEWRDKLARYRKYHQPELWLVDPTQKTISIFVYQLGATSSFGADYAQVSPQADGSFFSPALPGLKLDLARVFANRRKAMLGQSEE